MRKYILPKYMYVLLISVICALSIGYTFAYFSAITTADRTMGVPKMQVAWLNNSGGSEMADSVELTNEFKLGEWMHIEYTGSQATDLLAIANKSEIDVYYRVKVRAYYTKDGVTTDLSQYVEIGRKLPSEGNVSNITVKGWKLEDGYYYYYGDSSKKQKLTKNQAQAFANYIKVDLSAGADLFGTEVSISLIVEAIQVANGATW